MMRSTDISGSLGRSALRDALAACGTSLAFGLLGIVLLFAGARWGMPAQIAGPVADGGWTARTRAWFITDGFSDPPEMDKATLHQFSWTIRRAARLLMPNLDRSHAYQLTLRVTASRPPDVPPPVLRVLVDGAVRGEIQTSNDYQTVTAELPPRSGAGAVVTLDVSETWVPATVLPGSGDKRTLGVIIDDIGIAPLGGHYRPVWSVIALAALAIALTVAGVLWCGLRSWLGGAASLAVTVGFTWLLLQDAALFGTFVERLVHISIGVAIFGAIVAMVRARWPVVAGLPEWSIAVGIVLCASAVKLAFFMHPLATVGDAVFQVHNAQNVHVGGYFFTSKTPRPFFEFPYAIALYVVAQPFWRFFPTVLDLARLLHGLALIADALVGVALYAAARRQWNDRLTALFCAGLWPFARAPLESLCTANLTNVFGQGMFGVALGLMIWVAAGTGTPIAPLVAAGVLLTVAFLSHFSTISVGGPVVCAVGVMLMLWGRAPLRRLGVWVIVIALLAAGVSYVVYYSNPRFTPVYRETMQRVVKREGEAPNRSMVAPPSVKGRRWILETTDNFGWPLLAGAVVGAALLARKRRREGMTLVLGGWVVVWAFFAALSIVSAIEMRANLATAPVFVCLGAYALGALARRSRLGVMLAAAGAIVIGCDGLRLWLMCLGR